MPRESRKARAARAQQIAQTLFGAHPDAHCELDYRNPFELLCATQLSAQCTDKVVNSVTPELFRRFPNAKHLAQGQATEIEQIIHRTGFYRNKARNLLAMAQTVCERYEGEIPHTLKELVKLPGVGRKTANVILGNAFDTPGMVVDTHVSRLSQRMALTGEKDPVKIERDLMELFPERDWTRLSHAMIFHGRRVCSARSPQCEVCPVIPDCAFPKQRLRQTGSSPRGRKTSRTKSTRRS